MDKSPDFKTHNRLVRISNTKTGCLLVIILMPVGAILDWFVYPDLFIPFLQLRVFCSFFSCIILFLLFAKSSKKYSDYALISVPVLPLLCMAGMIYLSEGFLSPYYAGLMLVIMAIGPVAHWTLKESIGISLFTVFIYLLAGLLHSEIPRIGLVVNNFYFLLLTSVIVVVGNHFYNRLRRQEFQSRYNLGESRQLLAEKNEELMAMDEMKMNFFANISHELRTPLTLLVSPLEKLRQQKVFRADEQAREHLDLMQTNAMRLLKLINDLLDLVKLDFSGMELHSAPIEIHSFMKGLVVSIQGAADDKGLVVEVSVDSAVGCVLADRDKLEKIILNLLFNAIKFTPGGGRIALRVWREEENLRMDVQDTGIGIPVQMLPHIFGRFWQVDPSAKRKHQGTGIGLALVKSLIELHGGGVTVESEPHKGSTFQLWMPYHAAQTTSGIELSADVVEPMDEGEASRALSRQAEQYPALTALRKTRRADEFPSDSSRCTILVVDDEPDMLQFLRSEIRPKYNFIGAVDGIQGLEKAKQFLPDVILLDMMMPGKDGIEVCRAIRKNKPTEMIPVILITARATDRTKLKALDAGANDFLTKPFSTTELHTRIENLIHSTRLQRELKTKNQTLKHTMDTLAETESQLIQVEKMDSLGQLSAGLIHEINNPLNIASMGLHILRKKSEVGVPDDPEKQADFLEVLNNVEEGVQRTSRLVADLRTFTHPSNDFSEVSLPGVLEMVRRFLSDRFASEAAPACTITVPDDLVVWGNQGHLVQVFLNLMQNALDILDEKEFIGPEAPAVEVTAKRIGDNIQCTVYDNGMGVPKSVRAKLFDPFFTTKEIGKGMGMGLSICYRIIQQHQGTIEVASEPGLFTKFIVTLSPPPSAGGFER